MKRIILFTLSMVLASICRADNPGDSAFTKTVRLFGVDLREKSTSEVNAGIIMQRLRAVGNREKILIWLLNRSDSINETIWMEYRHLILVLRISSIVKNDGQRIDVQMDFDDKGEIANTFFAITPFKCPVPENGPKDETQNEVFKTGG
jgi:hypothetical protein